MFSLKKENITIIKLDKNPLLTIETSLLYSFNLSFDTRELVPELNKNPYKEK